MFDPFGNPNKELKKRYEAARETYLFNIGKEDEKQATKEWKEAKKLQKEEKKIEKEKREERGAYTRPIKESFDPNKLRKTLKGFNIKW